MKQNNLLKSFCLTICLLAMVFIASPAFSQSAVDYQHSTDFYVGIQKVTPQQIQEVLPDTKGKPVFLEFKSKFCLACQKMDPFLEELLPKYPGVEKRIYDMMKDRKTHPEVFALFKPAVVPIQIYINDKSEIINVYYDFHTEKEISAALDCIDPIKSKQGCHLENNSQSKVDQWQDQITLGIKQSLDKGKWIVLLLAFIGGVISSVFPCSISMLPIIIGYIGGTGEDSKWKVLEQVLFFILGLATVLTVFGVIASVAGITFGAFIGSGMFYAVGALAILMGLQLLHVIHIPMPQFVTRLPEAESKRILGPYILGLAFGLVSSPCGTPVLAALLGIISQEKDVALGAASLFVYAIGQGALILVAGMFTGFLKHVAVLRHVGDRMMIFSGILLLLAGVAFILHGAGVW